MAEANNIIEENGVQTVTLVKTTQKSDNTKSPVIHLKLEKKVEEEKKVKWEEGTVDNEFMNKKKSKCCCIYEKPKVFGESSSSDSEDECGHCRGHKKKCYKKHLAMGQAEDGHDHRNNVDSSNKPDQTSSS